MLNPRVTGDELHSLDRAAVAAAARSRLNAHVAHPEEFDLRSLLEVID